MHYLFKSSAALALAALLGLLAVSDSRAQAGPNGNYQTSVEFGGILLNGIYPFELFNLPAGTLDVVTSGKGKLTGRVAAFGQFEDAVGSIRVRGDRIRLRLKGKVAEGRISVAATLQGSAFIGRATIRGKTGPCRIDVSGADAIVGRYQLSLAPIGKGRVTGSGTLAVGSETSMVSVRGTQNKSGDVALKITGSGTVAQLGRGQLVGNTFTFRKTTVQGFGALAKGTNLKLTATPP